MTEWLDDVLDQSPCGEVPPGFSERVLKAVAEDDSVTPVLRPKFGKLSSQLVAAALLLAVGFWLGQDRPDLAQIEQDPISAEVSAGELVQIYNNHGLYQDWELAIDESIDLSLSDLAAGTWDPLDEKQED